MHDEEAQYNHHCYIDMEVNLMAHHDQRMGNNLEEMQQYKWLQWQQNLTLLVRKNYYQR